MGKRQLPTPQDETDKQIMAWLDSPGWAVLGVEAEGDLPQYAFTLGLTHNFDHPEILLMGLRHETAHELLNLIAHEVQEKKTFVPGQKYEGLAKSFPLMFVPVLPKRYKDWVGYAAWLYQGQDFTVLQCVWPDHSGVFPWESEDPDRFASQRLLGSADQLPNGWLFADPPNSPVVTLAQIIERKVPIRLGLRESEEVTWQFLHGETVLEMDALIVGLGEMVKQFPEIEELADLKVGWAAQRNPDGSWTKGEREITDD